MNVYDAPGLRAGILKLNPHQLATLFALSTTLATITHPAKSSTLDSFVASNYTTATTFYTQQTQDRKNEVDIQYVLFGLRRVGAPPLTVAPEDLKQQKFVVEAEPSETVSSVVAHDDTPPTDGA